MQKVAQFISDFYEPGSCEWNEIGNELVSELYSSNCAVSQVQWALNHYLRSHHCIPLVTQTVGNMYNIKTLRSYLFS